MRKLSECISPAFYELHQKIKNNEYTHYWLKGGRGSTKSSFVSIEIIMGIIEDSASNCVCFRKVGATLKDSCFAQLLWAIDILEVGEYFRSTLNPLRIYYKPTGQTIYFRGLDDAKKTKSIKPRKGYFKFCWFEELEEFTGMEEIRKAVQSLMRGGEDYTYFYSFNPPRNSANWVNFECGKAVSNRFVHHSDYRFVPKEWLGEEFIIEAELLKEHDKETYEHEYLGLAVGNGLNIFTNVSSREIRDEDIMGFDNIRQGIDWGFAVDPFVYVKLHYDRKRRKVYIFDEIYAVGLSNRDAIERIKKIMQFSTVIVADSSEPKSIAEFRDSGINIRGADKGPDSVSYGIKQLQNLFEIIIDEQRCPHTYKEFVGYEFERMKNGDIRSSYPDKNNHTIDAIRYALEADFVKRGLF